MYAYLTLSSDTGPHDPVAKMGARNVGVNLVSLLFESWMPHRGTIWSHSLDILVGFKIMLFFVER